MKTNPCVKECKLNCCKLKQRGFYWIWGVEYFVFKRLYLSMWHDKNKRFKHRFMQSFLCFAVFIQTENFCQKCFKLYTNLYNSYILLTACKFYITSNIKCKMMLFFSILMKRDIKEIRNELKILKIKCKLFIYFEFSRNLWKLE